MIPIDLSGKVALVTGVGDNESFAWFIAKALNAAGATIVLASHPRMVGIVESILSDRRYAKFSEYSIQGTVDAVGREFGGIDMVIHSIAFSREITKRAVETSRAAYSEALGISAYSLTSLLRAAE